MRLSASTVASDDIYIYIVLRVGTTHLEYFVLIYSRN